MNCFFHCTLFSLLVFMLLLSVPYFLSPTWQERVNFIYIVHYRIMGSELVIAIFVVTGFAFIPAGCILFLVYERANKSKHLQLISGLNPLVYWFSTILCDLVRIVAFYHFLCSISLFRLFSQLFN